MARMSFFRNLGCGIGWWAADRRELTGTTKHDGVRGDSPSTGARPYSWLRAFAGLCLMLVAVTVFAAAEPRFRRFGIEDGLPAGWVTEMTEDRDGYLWLATRDGLARYDGVNFKRYQFDPRNPDGIPCADVQTVFQTSQGRILVGCSDTGLAELVDAESGRFRRFATEAKVIGLDDWSVFTIDEDAKGQVWLGTYYEGVIRFDPSSGALSRLSDLQTLPESLHHAVVIELLIHDGLLHAGTSAGLWIIAPGTRVLTETPLFAADTVSSLMHDGDAVLVAASLHVHRVVVADAAVRSEPLPIAIPNYVDGLARDRQGILWIATLAGVIEAPPTGPTRLVASRRAVTSSLPDNKLTDALIDREGGLWLSTSGAGIAYLRPDWQRFEIFENDPLDPGSLPSDRMQAVAICPDGSQFAISLAGDLVRLDPSLVRIGRLPLTAVTALHCDRQGQLWVGADTGLQQVDQSGTVRRRFSTADGLPPGRVGLIADGANGDIWLATTASGVARLQADGAVLTLQTREQGIVVPSFEQLLLAPDQRMWLADGQGLRVFDPACACLRGVEGILHRVETFAFIDRTRLLAFSAGELIELEIVDATHLRERRRLGAADGLPPTAAASLLPVAKERFWLTTARGLYDIDLHRGRALQIAPHLGSALQFGLRPTAQVRDGVFLDATLSGVMRTRTVSSGLQLPAPVLRLQAATVEHDDGSRSQWPAGGVWSLAHDDRNLQVSARLLSLLEASGNRYWYWLEGSESGYGQASDHPFREFARLPPGDYRLHVRAENSVGMPASVELIQNLIVRPPWWRTWVAYAGYAVLVIALVLLILKAYQRQLKARHHLQMQAMRAELAAKADQAKTEFLADIGHEIRTPMSGVLGMADLLLGESLTDTQNRWVQTIKRSGQYMLSLINDLLDLSRIEAGQLLLTPTPVRLAELLHDVAQMEASLLAAKQQTLQIDCPPTLELQVDGKRLRQILINLLGNACKFTPHGGAIRIVVTVSDTEIEIAVHDQGPGLSADERARLFARFAQTDLGRSQGGSGLGLAICQRLVHAMAGTINLVSEPGQGSTFVVQLPGSMRLPEAVGSTPEARDRPSAGLEGLQVLVVEDDPVLAEILLKLIARLGVHARLAPQALSALAELATAPVDVVLSDLDLPGVDGLALAGMIRQQFPSVRLVAMTARVDSEAATAALAAGFQKFARKPLDPDALRDLLSP
ncbi:hypothetical protein C7S18_18115 [Ahniella affigens]|uniref:histidine kinase n=1 Tax=Ahniella affigens TaxID=2021234 RepID=A0A2P1PVU8_9GAMM|nr:hybrid sensor histidine kinase/response regulator [Ahniella affigens]AVP98971.1 hypothetical protein C7S18_18115 [Ahniella affigens]